MGATLPSLTHGISAKIAKIANRQAELKRTIRDLRAENETLRQELAETQHLLAEANRTAEYLSLSHKLADNPGALADARDTVKGLLKKVERAINLLNTDPATT